MTVSLTRPAWWLLHLWIVGYTGVLIGAAVSTRQILLHILPGDPGFGVAILGMHLYTWGLISFLITLLVVAVLGVLAPVVVTATDNRPVARSPWSTAVIGLFVATLVGNAIMIVLLQGFAWLLPDDPASYRLLEQLQGL